MKNKSILDVQVSAYSSRFASSAGITMNLLDILHSRRNDAQVLAMRAEADPIKRQELKNKLPCYTATGIFYPTRAKVNLVRPSGLANVDIDHLDGRNVLDVLNDLRSVPFIAYCGTSCSGKNLHCIVPLGLHPDLYDQQYDALIEEFKKLGFHSGNIDRHQKAANQCRFCSFNTPETEWYAQKGVTPFLAIAPEREKIIYPVPPANFHIDTDGIFAWALSKTKEKYSFIEGSRFVFINRCAWFCFKQGLSENETLAGLMQYSDKKEYPEKKIKHIVNFNFHNPKDPFKWEKK